MKTKIAKRIGPVPIALVAVLALAAFISAGLLLATNGVQTAQAQSAECPNAVTMDTTTAMCDVVGDSAVVNLENATGTAVVVYVYVRDGSISDGTTASLDGPEATDRDNTLYSLARLPIPAQSTSASTGAVVPGKLSVTVTPASGKTKAEMFAYFTDDAPVTSGRLANSAFEMLTIYFVGAPVAKSNVDDDEAKETVSALVITEMEVAPSGTDVLMSEDGVINSGVNNGPAGDLVTDVNDANKASTGIDAPVDKVWISAEFNDKNLRPVNGTIEISIGTPSAGAEGARFAGGGDATRRSYGDNFESVQIERIPKNIDVRIPVMATITSQAGSTLELKGYIQRKGDPTMVDASAYICAKELAEHQDLHDDDANNDELADSVTADDVNDASACMSEIDDLADDSTSNDPDALAAISPGGFFFISAKSTDSVGNTITDTTKSTTALNWEVTSDADNVDDAEEAISGDDDSGTTNTVIQIYDKAKLGTYSLTVEEGDASTMVIVIVSGKTSKIEITGPDMIPTDTGLATYMVTATDSAGNLPSDVNDLDGNYTVAVRSKDAEVLGLVNDKVNFDEKTGIGQFQVLLPLDAVVGSTVSITVSHGTITATKAVTYGEAGSTPTVPGAELGTVTDVITGFNRGGALQVSWTKAANASGYIIIAINVNDVNNDVVAVVLNDGDLDTQNISGLTPGATYDIYVAATASGGRNTLSDAARVTAK